MIGVHFGVESGTTTPPFPVIIIDGSLQVIPSSEATTPSHWKKRADPLRELSALTLGRPVPLGVLSPHPHRPTPPAPPAPPGAPSPPLRLAGPNPEQQLASPHPQWPMPPAPPAPPGALSPPLRPAGPGPEQQPASSSLHSSPPPRPAEPGPEQQPPRQT
jgi:hypothetical protein